MSPKVSPHPLETLDDAILFGLVLLVMVYGACH